MDRIFPNKSTESGDNKTLKLIDANQLLSALQNQSELPIRTSSLIVNTDSVDSPIVTAKAKDLSNVPPQLREHIEKLRNKKNKDNDDDTEEDEKEEDEKEDKDDDTEEEESSKKMTKKGKEKMAQSRQRKIHFTSSDQINAEAAERALASGDDVLYRSIMAARQERRVKIAQKLTQQLQDNETKQKLAQRNTYRMNLVKEAEKAESNDRISFSNIGTKSASVEKSGFKKVSELNDFEKQTFAQIANSYGFPQEYVEAMLPATPEAENIIQIKDIMASNLSEKTKKQVVASMFDEVHKQDLDRLKHYWKDELGYQDTEWIDYWLSDKPSEFQKEASSKKKIISNDLFNNEIDSLLKGLPPIVQSNVLEFVKNNSGKLSKQEIIDEVKEIAKDVLDGIALSNNKSKNTKVALFDTNEDTLNGTCDLCGNSNSELFYNDKIQKNICQDCYDQLESSDDLESILDQLS